MDKPPTQNDDAQAEIEVLRARLEEAEESIRAIRSGEVDAVVVSGPDGEQVYTLTGAEHTYRILVEAMNEGALVLSPEGLILYCNATFAAMLGAPVYDLLGHSIYAFVAENDVEPLRIMLRKAPLVPGKSEIAFKHPESKAVPAFVSVSNLPTPEGASVSAVVTDLTEHKRAESELRSYRENLEDMVVERTRELAAANEELAESEQQITGILESISDGFFALDNEFRFIFVNSEGSRQIRIVTGISGEELLGRVFWEVAPLSAGTPVYEACMKAASEQTVVDFETYFAEPDRWFRLRIFPSPNGLTVYAEDISEQKIAEAIVRQKNAVVRAINRIFRETLIATTERQLGDTCLAAARELTDSCFGFIGEIDAAGNYSEISRTDRPAAISEAKGLEPGQAPPPKFKTRGLIERTIVRGQVLLINDAAAETENVGLPEGYPSPAAFLATPLMYAGKVIGIVGLCDRQGGYRAEDISSIEALAPAFVEILMRKRAEKELAQAREEVLERQRHIAEVLQQALVPPDVPSEIGRYRIGVRYRAALLEAEVGGDFYDVFEIGEDYIGVLIGDVTGKGLQAAILVAAARYSIRSYAFINPQPSFVLRLANGTLCQDSGMGSNFLTGFYLSIDKRSRTVTYAGAGHEPPVICRADGTIEELEIGGMPLGIDRDAVYEDRSIQMEPGDTVVMVTDGITEARIKGKEMFETGGITSYLSQCQGSSPDEIAGGILQAATDHAGGKLQDDAAVVVLQMQSE